MSDALATLQDAAARLTAAVDAAAARMADAPGDPTHWCGAVVHAHAVAADVRTIVPPLLPALAVLPADQLTDALTMARDLLTAGDVLAVLSAGAHAGT